MKIPANLTFDEVQKRHPEELKSLIKTLRNSTSKEKTSDETNMKFEYGYAVRCQSYTLDELITNHENEVASPPPPKTEDERVADMFASATPVTLHAKIGRWRGYEKVPNPPEMETLFRANAQRIMKEESRRKALTPEEQDAEVKELLSSLRGGMGFVQFTR